MLYCVSDTWHIVRSFILHCIARDATIIRRFGGFVHLYLHHSMLIQICKRNIPCCWNSRPITRALYQSSLVVSLNNYQNNYQNNKLCKCIIYFLLLCRLYYRWYTNISNYSDLQVFSVVYDVTLFCMKLWI